MDKRISRSWSQENNWEIGTGRFRIEKQSGWWILDGNEIELQVIVAQKVIAGLYKGVSTVELDNLAAETAASMTTHHPDYAILAARIAVSNLHKKTEKVHHSLKWNEWIWSIWKLKIVFSRVNLSSPTAWSFW